jgi:hypothetical protein
MYKLGKAKPPYTVEDRTIDLIILVRDQSLGYFNIQ